MKKNLAGLIIFIVLLFIGFSSVNAQFKVPGKLGNVLDSAGGNSPATRAIIKGATATYEESKKASENLTPENEYYLGRAVAAQIAARYPIYNDPDIQNYLNNILNTIVINAPFQKDAKPPYKGYHVAILDSDEINAFATPGGHIFVTRGLVACAPNEDALASVLAHEVSHVRLRHAVTAIRNARYTNALLSGAAEGLGGNAKELANMLGDSVNEIITTLMINGFSKSQEFEADATAISLLAAAGYKPSSINEVLETLKQKQHGGKGFGKTHPSPAERIAAVNKNLGKYNVEDTASFRAKRFSDITSR